MANRAHCMVVARDPSTGATLLAATVNVYSPGTVTPISATIFDKNGNVLSNPLTSDATTGLVDFYLNVAQEVDLVVAKAGYTTRTYSNVPVIDDAGYELTALLTTTGDVPYASAANTPARLPIGSTGQRLQVSGGVPSWQTVGAASAVGSANAPTITSATYVDITDMTATLTTTGGDLLVMMTIIASTSTTAANFQVAFSLDGAAEVGGWTTIFAATTEIRVITACWRFASPSVGSHTVKGRGQTNTGTITINSTTRNIVAWEAR